MGEGERYRRQAGTPMSCRAKQVGRARGRPNAGPVFRLHSRVMLSNTILDPRRSFGSVGGSGQVPLRRCAVRSQSVDPTLWRCGAKDFILYRTEGSEVGVLEQRYARSGHTQEIELLSGIKGNVRERSYQQVAPRKLTDTWVLIPERWGSLNGPHQPQNLTPGLDVSVEPPTGNHTPQSRIIKGLTDPSHSSSSGAKDRSIRRRHYHSIICFATNSHIVWVGFETFRFLQGYRSLGNFSPKTDKRWLTNTGDL